MGDSANEFYNVPEFYIEAVKTEDAGNGNVRVLVYGKRGGTLVPLYSAVMAAPALVIAGQQLKDAAEHGFHVDRLPTGMCAH